MTKQIASMETKSLLAMCYILDEYHALGDAIMEVTRTKKRDIAYDLLRLTQGKNVIGAKDAKRILIEYKTVIDTINQYGYISNFIMQNYNWGEDYQAQAEYFYEYLLANRENLETIKEVLTKLVELEIPQVELDTGLVFDKRYKLDTNIYYNLNINYLANMRAIPNYQKGIIEYVAENSPYNLEVSTSMGQITQYSRKIKLNTLVFDPSLLPNEITKDNLFEEIKQLKKAKQEESLAIYDSVNIHIGLEDLQEMILQFIRTINSIQDEERKTELKASMEIILEQIAKMEAVKEKMEDTIVDKHPEITEDKLELEKKLYKHRRTYNNLDLC